MANARRKFHRKNRGLQEREIRATGDELCLVLPGVIFSGGAPILFPSFGAKRMRLPRLMALLLLPAALGMSLGLAGNVTLPPCLMAPHHIEMRLPIRGLTWLPDEDLSGTCDRVPATKWLRSPEGAEALFVYADGPSGSGRSWTVTAGVGGRQQSGPTRGVCFTASTVGWRTLQHFRNGPLPWRDDLDHDGKAEVIVWDSFALHEDASMAEHGLVAWVYRLNSDNTLALDWSLSRQMAREIAEAYRAPLDSKESSLAPLRTQAAEALERFADQQCSIEAAPGEK